MNNKDILERVEKIIEIGKIKDRRTIEDIIRCEFKRRTIETRRIEENNKLSINLAYLKYLEERLGLTGTPIEEYMLDELFNAKLMPEKQYSIGTKVVDFAFQEQKLVVECDGYKWHKQDKEQIERDIERDKYLARKGWRVLHFSGVQIRRNIEGCINEIKEALFLK